MFAISNTIREVVAIHTVFPRSDTAAINYFITQFSAATN